MLLAPPILLVPGSVHGVPHKLKERKAKQAYYYDRGAKELNRLKPGDVVRVKRRPNSKEWTRATVDKEVDIRSYQDRTEDGRTYRRNRRHLRQTREPFLRAPFVESSTDLAQQQQPKGVVPSGNVAALEVPTRKPASEVPPTRKSVSEVPTSSSVIQPESTSVQATRSSDIVSVPASGVSTSAPAVTVTTTRSGRVVKKPVRYDS